MEEFYQNINDLYNLHLVSRRIEHGIGYDKDSSNWRLFEPSKFVYAFFAYNTFYSIDWASSVREHRIICWDEEESHLKQNYTECMKEYKKMKYLREFVYSSCIDLDNERDINERKVFFAENYSNNLRKNIEESKIKVETLEVILQQIVTDFSILQCDKDHFIKQLNGLVEGNLINKKFKDAVDDVMYFIYKVRNNIFHGSKTILDMSADKQRERLLIYTAIIITLNDLLFNTLEKTTDWSPKEVDFKMDSVIKRMNKERARKA